MPPWYEDRAAIRDGFAALEPQLDEVVSRFYARMFALAPRTRELFPATMRTQRARLARVLAHIVALVDRPSTLADFLAQLGRDHRKFDVASGHYPVFGQALLATLAESARPPWTPATAEAWQRLYDWMATTMTTSAEAERGPASYPAQVTDHQRLDRDTALVEVATTPRLPYLPGQYVTVEVPQRPRLWRTYSPITAGHSDADRLTFYVKALQPSGVARAIVGSTQVGDQWRLGPAQGQLHRYISPARSGPAHSDPAPKDPARSDPAPKDPAPNDPAPSDPGPGRGLLLIGGGTGIAPMLGILDHLARRDDHLSPAAGTAQSSQVVVFYGAPRQEQLHALAGLRELEHNHSWLTVLPVTEEDDAPEGFHSGTLADAVTRYGAWADHTVIVSGSPAMLRHTIAQMLVAGTRTDQIHYDPFTVD